MYIRQLYTEFLLTDSKVVAQTKKGNKYTVQISRINERYGHTTTNEYIISPEMIVYSVTINIRGV